jgi:hypothetical protein
MEYFVSFAKVLGEVPGPVGGLFGKVGKVFEGLGIT